MQAIELSTFTSPFVSVHDEHEDKPVNSFDLEAALGEPAVEYIRRNHLNDGQSISDYTHWYSARVFQRLTLDQLCKVRFSTNIMMDESVNKLFEENADLYLSTKIANSAWRWSFQSLPWNEVVDAYDAITRFRFGSDFEVRLDHTTGYNECGYSKYSRTFLDGVFAYLIHYKGQHVMTLGFSVLKDRTILIQQVQLKDRRGNRWLFKLPANYLEYVLDRFREAFPKHSLFLIDGQDVAEKSLRQYKELVKSSLASIRKYRETVKRAEGETLRFYMRSIADKLQTVAETRVKINHLRADVPRLKAFYANSGRYVQGEVCTKMKLRHYALTTT